MQLAVVFVTGVSELAKGPIRSAVKVILRDQTAGVRQRQQDGIAGVLQRAACGSAGPETNRAGGTEGPIGSARRITSADRERAGEALPISKGCGKIGGEQIASHSIRVDRAIEVASPVKVICEIERVPAAQITLDAEVGLLRVGINEIFRLWIAERLEAQRQESGTAGIG